MKITLSPHPIAQAAWETAVAAYKLEEPTHVEPLSYVIDLAREQFLLEGDGHEGEERYAAWAPTMARLILRIDALTWIAGRLGRRAA